MERLQNLSAINTNTIEGRLLIAALSKISGVIKTDESPDDILQQCHDIAENIYSNVPDIPSPIQEPQTFDGLLSSLVNKFSLENDSNTPDFILANYLIGCLDAYNKTLKARDKWFNLDVWAKTKG